MHAQTSIRGLEGWARSGRTGSFLQRAREMEILDRSYQIAAQLFVALIPLILAMSVAVTGGQQYLASSLIERFELVGFAADSVRDLFQSQYGHIYWFGVLLSLYAAFSLSKRVSRAYTSVWQVSPLPLREQWRGLVWVFLQLAMIAASSGLRRLLWHQGVVTGTLTALALFGVWVSVEFASQWLLTSGQVSRGRLWLAAIVVALGKAGASIWALWYLAHSMARQAELYGPLGVVFSLFTYLLVLSAVMLFATLAVAVATTKPGAEPAVPEAELDPEPR